MYYIDIIISLFLTLKRMKKNQEKRVMQLLNTWRNRSFAKLNAKLLYKYRFIGTSIAEVMLPLPRIG